jgi:isoquinoline 1-oxidoreductase beta subunit
MATHMRQMQPDSITPMLSRRQVMAGAAGLTLAVILDLPFGAEADAAISDLPVERTASPWVTIASDGTITIKSVAAEMGQGSMTSLPMIIAEELDADWSKIKVVPAPVVEAIYGNPAFGGMMYTAGSSAVTSYYNELRIFGAQVRKVLLANAARYLSVPVAELRTEPSAVVHDGSGRRLTYGEIVRFADIPAQAPEVTPDELKKPNEFRIITKDALRVELPSKINGTARYAIDVQLPGMLYGAVLRTPVEGGAPEMVDETKAKAIAGVVKIMRLPYGVGVIAETPWAAFDAKEALERSTTWKRTGTGWGFDSDAAIEAFARDAADLDVQATDWDKQGDVRAEMPKAATVIEASYRCDYAYHAQMEPLNCTASVSPDGSAAEIWVGTQSQTMAIESAAHHLGLSRDRIKLNDLLLGGGFGRRGHRDEEFITDAVLLSKEARRPVKVMWTREDDVHNGRMRPISAHHLRAGLDASGKLVAWHHRIAGDRVLPFADPVRFEKGGHKDGILMRGVELKSYDIPHQLSEQLYRDTGARTSPLRGIGFTANKFVTEAFLDEIAQQRGIDPVKLRLDLLKNTPRGRKVVERAAEMADWERRRDGRGLGFAFIDYSNTLTAGIAEVSVDRPSGTIKVHDFWCAIDCGTPVHPDNIIAQTESSIIYGLGLALTERISYKDGAVEQSGFYDYVIPRMSDVPDLHIEIVRTDAHPTGVGQMATPLVAPAIANAVAQLTGVRLRESPMTAERVKKALA